MICHCGAKMKCVDSRPGDRGTRRKWACPDCCETLRTLERPVDEWKALDRLVARLVAISNLAKEANEIIYDHFQGGKR